MSDLPSGLTPLLFVRAYHNLPAISEGDWVDYYHPQAISRLRWDLKEYVEHQLDLFSPDASFAFGECEPAQESLRDGEVAVFQLALQPRDRGTPLDELHPLDQLRGFRAVIVNRISCGDLDAIRAALWLFDYIMESGIGADTEGNPHSSIRLELAGEFAPWLIGRLLGCVESLTETWRCDPYRKFIGAEFEPFKPLLDGLQRVVSQPGWPQNDLCLGRVLLIVDHFKWIVEERWHQ